MTLFSPATQSSLQALAIEGALTSAAFNAVGGTAWTVIEASGGNVATNATIAVTGLLTGYVNRMKMDAARQAMPATTIYGAPWLWIASDDQPPANCLLVSADDPTLVFLVVGTAADDYGYVLAPLAVSQAPDLGTASKTRLRQGLRIGLQAGF